MSARPELVEGRAARSIVVLLLALVVAAPVCAHELERTRVSIAFGHDGSFVLDVSNDPRWLKLRLEPFEKQGSRAPDPLFFADRVVLWVDGREVRPTSVEYLAAPSEAGLATYRLRGRMPLDARTLRWYYGLVIDPYPLTIHRADGRVPVEEIAGDAWSRTIDLSGQFQSPMRLLIVRQLPIVGMLSLFALGLTVRLIKHKGHKGH